MSTEFTTLAQAELAVAKARVAALEALLIHIHPTAPAAPAPRARKPGVAKASAETVTGPTGQKLVRKPRKPLKAAGAPRAPREGGVPARVLETLRKNGEPVGPDEIANLIEAPKPGVYSALQQLSKRGHVQRHGERGKYTYSAVHMNGASA